jgi:ASC-1-like (ASCH) protein/ribosomal protein S18 acetylase RimI-like enzyme
VTRQRRQQTMATNSFLIREAQDNDFQWVSNLMQNALEPYYGGDHRAHAKRIFDAHIMGGFDQLGFFSFEQRMFIIEMNGECAGMIHLVGKRQSTYKISPLIVDPKFQGQFGIGSQLLDYAETYARNHQARQLYCTVAEKNILAMQFFLGKGFIRAGSSDSHYKNDITETMLYKPLYGVSKIRTLDELHVSVLPLDENNTEIKEQIGRLLLEKLQSSFEGITDDWITALFTGYSRRHTLDINTKYKLIYVATDSMRRVIGVAGATPKKGSPIKVMPFIATNAVAFEALLIDIPHQLVPYGHKLYIHINPTADEVISLQRLGWKLDAVMPSAYSLGIITQQWSMNIGGITMRTMRVKQRFYDLIYSGKKTLEVRVGYDTINRIQTGECIRLMSHIESCEVKINAIRRYRTFEEMLKIEPWERISPDSKSCNEVLSLLRQIYPAHKEKLGVVVLEFAQINK